MFGLHVLALCEGFEHGVSVFMDFLGIIGEGDAEGIFEHGQVMLDEGLV